MKKFQKIDILVNSAAMILRKPIEEVTDEEWNAILSINLTGIFISCQVVGREMIKRRQGKIINISSNVAQVLQPGRGAYAVTKAAVSHLTRVLAFEWAPYHINVNAVAPGPTLTEFNRKYFDEHPEDLKARIQSMPLGADGTAERSRGRRDSPGVPGFGFHHRPDDLCRRRVYTSVKKRFAKGAIN